MSSAFRPWRIAVTGLTGFVGTHFRRHMSELGRPDITVVPLAVDGERAVDIRDARQVAGAIIASHPDVVLHLAAIALPASAKADPGTAWDVNVIGTLNIAQAMKSGAPHARLIYVGSSEAYGSSFMDSAEPLPERAALVPRSAYGSTKASADLMIGQMALDGLNAVRFRPFNHTGPGQTSDYVVPAFARQIAMIERGLQPPLMQVGNLEAERDFLDVRDVVAAYALAALPETEMPAGAVMNLSTGSPLRIDEILSTLLTLAKLPIATEVDPLRLRPTDIKRASGSPHFAKSMLGWEPRIPIKTAIEDVLEFWRHSKN